MRPAQKGRSAGKALAKSEAAKTPMVGGARPRTSAEQSAARVAPEQASKKRVVTKTTVAKSAADPDFRAQAARLYAPLRYLAPADYGRELREAEAGFRKLWQEAPWADN